MIKQPDDWGFHTWFVFVETGRWFWIAWEWRNKNEKKREKNDDFFTMCWAWRMKKNDWVERKRGTRLVFCLWGFWLVFFAEKTDFGEKTMTGMLDLLVAERKTTGNEKPPEEHKKGWGKTEKTNKTKKNKKKKNDKKKTKTTTKRKKQTGKTKKPNRLWLTQTDAGNFGRDCWGKNR